MRFKLIGKTAALLVITISFAFAGCSGVISESVSSSYPSSPLPPSQSSDISQNSLPEPPIIKEKPPPVPQLLEENYCVEVARKVLSAEKLKGASQTQTALNIYDYIIENVYFAKPLGLDIWRYRSSGKAPPDYVENRSLSPLLFGTGWCEDYAAAMVLLLLQGGIDAQYVAGYTLSVNGRYTDHAWVVAKIDGNWYHFDPQLEQNVTRKTISYRFFMRSDNQMLPDHLWGESLISYVGALATQDEIAIIRSQYTPPPCFKEAQKPPSRTIVLPPKPDVLAIEKSIATEKEKHGRLTDIPLSTAPPVLVAAQPLEKTN